jgi:endonuclease YncB( thermonuclease family)
MAVSAFRVRGLAARRCAAIALTVLLLAAGAGGVRSEDALPWTDQPTRVDPSAQSFDRLPDAPAPPAPVDTFPLRLDATGRYTTFDSVTFARDGTRYRLAHLEPVPSRKICTDREGARWACGVRARAALSSLLSGRGLRCRDVGKGDGATIVECLRSDRDLGEMLAEEGHAYAGDTFRYAPDEEKARKAGAGVWAAVEPR